MKLKIIFTAVTVINERSIMKYLKLIIFAVIEVLVEIYLNYKRTTNRRSRAY